MQVLNINCIKYAGYTYRIMNGNSFIINKTGHIDLLVDWYTWTPSVFKVKEMLVSLLSGWLSEQSS